MCRQSVSYLRDHIDGRDSIVICKVISDWHRLVREDIELLWVLRSSVKQNVEILRLIALVGERETFAWPS